MQRRGLSLEVRGLTVRLGNRPVLVSVNLHVPASAYMVVLGPSGSGKTTLLRAIAGLVEASEGSVLIGGKDYTWRPPWERPIALVQQIPGLLPHLTVIENVALAAELRAGLPRSEALREAYRILSRVGLSNAANMMPGQLSGGQLQRAALAAALAANPSILLLDEPLSHLDRPLAENLRGLLKSLQREYGVTVVHVTHDQDEALAVSTHVALLLGGRIEGSGETLEFYLKPPTLQAARFLGHNMVDGRLLGYNGYCVTFPPEAVEVGEGEYTGIVASVEYERGRASVEIVWRSVKIKAYVHPSKARMLRKGGSVRFTIDQEYVVPREAVGCGEGKA